MSRRGGGARRGGAGREKVRAPVVACRRGLTSPAWAALRPKCSAAYLTQLSSVVTGVLTPVSYTTARLGSRCLFDLRSNVQTVSCCPVPFEAMGLLRSNTRRRETPFHTSIVKRFITDPLRRKWTAVPWRMAACVTVGGDKTLSRRLQQHTGKIQRQKKKSGPWY